MDERAPLPEAQRAALIAEVAAGSRRIVPAEVLHIARATDGRVVWLDRTGLAALLRPERIAEFAEVPGLPVRALVHGRRIGQVAGGEVHVLAAPGRHELVVAVAPAGRITDTRLRHADET